MWLRRVPAVLEHLRQRAVAVERAIWWAGYAHLPFIHPTMVRARIDGLCTSILDVGCGPGLVMNVVNRDRRFFAVGVDIFPPHLDMSSKKTVFQALVCADIRRPPFQPKSFDCVLCCRTAEYLRESEAATLMEDCERLARRQVIIVVVTGFHPGEGRLDPYQEQRSEWRPAQMRALGYRVRGVGLRFLRPRKDWTLFFRLAVWVVAGPFVYWVPSLAAYLLCVKTLPVTAPSGQRQAFRSQRGHRW